MSEYQLDSDYCNKYIDNIKKHFNKEIEKNIERALVFACVKLRPDLDPMEFVKECLEEAKQL